MLVCKIVVVLVFSFRIYFVTLHIPYYRRLYSPSLTTILYNELYYEDN